MKSKISTEKWEKANRGREGMDKRTETVNTEQTLTESEHRQRRIFDSIHPTEFALLLLEILVNNRSPMHTGILFQKWKESLYKPQIEISSQERNQHSVKEISLTMINNM